MKHRRKRKGKSSRPLGEFAYFENGQRRIVQVHNKRQFHQQLVELDLKPWIGSTSTYS